MWRILENCLHLVGVFLNLAGLYYFFQAFLGARSLGHWQYNDYATANIYRDIYYDVTIGLVFIAAALLFRVVTRKPK